jgi:hypothetical protein
MTLPFLWLPDVLRAAGLKVALVDGWETRGTENVGKTLGVICHHTATVGGGNMPTLGLLIKGRPDLKGPLCQLGLGRDGTYYVIAAGRANHAGPGSWNGIVTGNSSFIRIEAENSGRKDDPWPDIQVDAYEQGVAAILAHIGRTAASCCGHKEYALPAGRKSDPDIDMNVFRDRVAKILAGEVPRNRGPRSTMERESDAADALHKVWRTCHIRMRFSRQFASDRHWVVRSFRPNGTVQNDRIFEKALAFRP